MGFETAVYSAIKSAITSYTGYVTVWNKTIFTVEDFSSDIPSGIRNRGACPFVAILGGIADDFSQSSGGLFEGTADIDLMLCISRPIVRNATDWDTMQVFTSEIEMALSEIEGNGILMKPSTSKDNPESGKGMITRLLTVTIDGAECRST